MKQKIILYKAYVMLYMKPKKSKHRRRFIEPGLRYKICDTFLVPAVISTCMYIRSIRFIDFRRTLLSLTFQLADESVPSVT